MPSPVRKWEVQVVSFIGGGVGVSKRGQRDNSIVDQVLPENGISVIKSSNRFRSHKLTAK